MPALSRRRLLGLAGLLGVPGLGALLAACGQGPEEVPALPADADGPRTITYGEDASQFGELTLPAGTPRGVAVVVHGGFWLAQYGIEYARPLVPSLVEQGWAVWAIEYRRVGDGGGVPTTLDDVTAALALVPDLDTGAPAEAPVVGIGHSAGGHLVTWAAAGGVLTHVISQAGVLDLVAASRERLGGGAVEGFLGHVPDPSDPADAAVDPVRQVPLAAPVWCVHGEDDTIVPISQSESYVVAATAAGAVAEVVRVPGDHFAVIDPDSAAWARTLEITAAL
ncbi:alpha/beta hydrolase family protein [Nocardioides sp.]|uniref:alpha/beta hydrolase family protein n=1 Tax=Nocardioides sp. TaxID=35761 RepID=UPI0035120473